MKKKQTIKCDVHTCEYCNCDCDMCNLEEIKVKNQKNEAQNKDETICSNYKLDKTKKWNKKIKQRVIPFKSITALLFFLINI